MADILDYHLIESTVAICGAGMVPVVLLVCTCSTIVSRIKRLVTAFCGQPLAGQDVAMLSDWFLVVIAYCMWKFFRHFVFERVYTCSSENGFDCFGDEQQLDCEDLAELENVKSIVCYRFLFDITHALSEALYVLTVSVGYISSVTWILIKAVNLKCMAQWIKHSVVTLLHIVIILATCGIVILRNLKSVTTVHADDMAELWIHFCVIYYTNAAIPWQKFDTVS